MEKVKQQKIKVSFPNRMLKIIAGTLTTVWILILCFPIYWMLVTSLSGGVSEYSDDMSLGVRTPLRYTVVIDYSKQEADSLGEEGMFLQANSLLWRMYNYKTAKIGMAEVISTIEGKESTSYTLSKANYEIYKESMWTKNKLKHSDIERVITVIEEGEYVEVTYEPKLSDKQATNASSEEMFTDFSQDEDIVGNVINCTQRKSYASLFDNYKIAWAYPNSIGLETGLFGPIMNTVFVALAKICLNILISALAAYSMSKLLPRNLKYKIQMIIMASSMVPATLMLIPKYQMVQNLGLNDSLWALILNGCASLGAMLLFKGTFDSYPNEILEAASIDGASEIYKFFKLVLPAAKGIIGVQIFSVFGEVWNEYFWSSMVIRDETKYTVSLILNYMMNVKEKDFVILLALGFIISIPTLLLYAFFQKFLTYGIDYSGVKG